MVTTDKPWLIDNQRGKIKHYIDQDGWRVTVGPTAGGWRWRYTIAPPSNVAVCPGDGLGEKYVGANWETRHGALRRGYAHMLRLIEQAKDRKDE